MSQIGDTRVYTNKDEATSPSLKNCPNCRVTAVPRGIASTRPSDEAGITEKHCPNCGHVYGRAESMKPDIRVTSIAVTGAGSAVVITVNKGTLQMSAAVLPANVNNKLITWSVTAGTGTATIDSNGLLAALTNGTVTVNAISNDGSVITGTRLITLSNQS